MSRPETLDETDTEDFLEEMDQKTKVKQYEKVIYKEIAKLEYYAEQTNELIEENDIGEIEIVMDRMVEIKSRILMIIAQTQETKITEGMSNREVRLWKKNIKDQYTQFMEQHTLLENAMKQEKERDLKEKEKAIEKESNVKLQAEQKRLEVMQERQASFEQEVMEKKYELEKSLLEEKMKAELELIEKKMKIDRAQNEQAKLPKLTITPFNGTAMDWVRFENMFLSQVDSKKVADEVKFGYLLEMVCPKVRDKISNLKPSTVGYKTAWERLSQEYGQTQMVANAYVSEIINLPTVKGTNYDRVSEFYEKLNKCHDALQTLQKKDTISGLVMTTINKIPHVRPDIVRTDDSWESWTMDQLITNLQKWLKRNKPDETTEKAFDKQRREKNWYARGQEEPQASATNKRGPLCIFCQENHWGDKCTTFDTLEKKKEILCG